MTQDVNTEVREEEGGVASVESMCPRCGGNGTTKILMLDIPHFREIVLLAFECPHCHERNSEVQFAGLIGERGRKYALSVNEGDAEALNRQLVKSDHATLRIPELDFEIEAGTQKAELTTVEGVLTKAAANLRAYQDLRRAQQPEAAACMLGAEPDLLWGWRFLLARRPARLPATFPQAPRMAPVGAPGEAPKIS